MKTEEIQRTLSVRNLVEYVLRAGDLGGDSFVARDRAIEGTRGHRKLQKLRPPEYHAEMPVSHRIDVDGLTLDIVGRIDGVMPTEGGLLIEEIKTVTGDLYAVPDIPVHWAQAKIYAWIMVLQRALSEIQIRLTYVRLDPWDVREDCRLFTCDELISFADDLITRYLHWTRKFHEWPARRDVSIAATPFPFPEYRPGQRRMAVAAYRAIEAGCRLFVQAPTGIGKTISALFPAVKAMGEGRTEKIFYLTARTLGRTVAEKAVDDMRGHGLSIKSVTLTARDKICFRPEQESSCDPVQCPFALGYFDRINHAVADAFQQDTLTRPVIEDYARKHMVCPFELSLDLALWTDIIICDYNYVFDPRVYLRRFFMEQTGGKFTFLIDEAHNLVDRAREMFSADLFKQKTLDLSRNLRPHLPGPARSLSAINSYFVKLRKLWDADREEESGHGIPKRDPGAWISPDLPEDLLPILRKFSDAAEEALLSPFPFPHRETLVDYYYEALAFQRIAELFDERYITYAERHDRDLRLRLFCMDPSRLIRDALQRGSAAVFFSATLTPLAYFREILGGEDDDPVLSVDSPFPEEHLRLIMADHIGTTYRLRGDSYGDVVESIAAVVSGRRGNYMMYFPSYRYMEEVAARFQAAYPHIDVLLQTSGMSETDREAFLTLFDADRSDTLVGFAVMGGIFGEGIDLVGDRLVGATIVGVGLPQVCIERELIRDFFNGRDIDGFAYAYMYPGMNRVLQAAGRVIRSETDRGVVLLIDQRFGHARYRRLFPAWWRSVDRIRQPDQIRTAVERFWNGEADAVQYVENRS